MDLPSYFRDFLSDIRPTAAQRKNYKDGHRVLRERLNDYEPLKDAIVSTFLQGSYKRSTAVRPAGKKRPDVDVIVVTKLHRNTYEPAEVLEIFEKFVKKDYEGKYRLQGRSIGIELTDVDLDLVPTAAPSEAEMGLIVEARRALGAEDLELDEDLDLGERLVKSAAAIPLWKKQPLLIPDRDAGRWDETHPLEQLRWTIEKNNLCGGHFVNVVKCIKWWRQERLEKLKHPKGFPLERLVGDCCPDGVSSVADGVVQTMEKFVSRYASYRSTQTVPRLQDYGVPEHNVLGRLDATSFATLYDAVQKAAQVARAALASEDLEESVKLWRELFGTKFPPAPDGCKRGGFSPREEVSVPGCSGRFA